MASETIEDIIAEKRELAEKLRWGTPSLDEIEAAVNLEFDANRIEAAWKRESTQNPENCVVGNSAAMREALDAVVAVGYPHNFQREAPHIRGYCYEITEAIKKCFAARSAPPRNCDRFADELDAQLAFLNEVWLISIDRDTMDEQDEYDNWTDEMRKRYGRWLLAPVTERKGEGDGQ